MLGWGGGGGRTLVGVSRVTAATDPPSSSGQPAPVIFVVPSKAEQQQGSQKVASTVNGAE